MFDKGSVWDSVSQKKIFLGLVTEYFFFHDEKVSRWRYMCLCPREPSINPEFYIHNLVLYPFHVQSRELTSLFFDQSGSNLVLLLKKPFIYKIECLKFLFDLVVRNLSCRLVLGDVRNLRPVTDSQSFQSVGCGW